MKNRGLTGRPSADANRSRLSESPVRRKVRSMLILRTLRHEPPLFHALHDAGGADDPFDVGASARRGQHLFDPHGFYPINEIFPEDLWATTLAFG